MQPKIRQSSVLYMPTCLCLCLGRPRYRYGYAYACAYVVAKARLDSAR